MNQTLITQATLETVDFELNKVAANLIAHANSDLARAHGINVLYYAPGSVHDSFGNDISVYRDDHGEAIGDCFVVFTLDSGIYYAPGIFSDLSGQTPLTTDAFPNVSPPVIKNSPLITNVIAPDLAAAIAVNTDILLPHTLQAYWEAHGGMSAQEEASYDSIGHQIGTHVVLFTFGGVTYKIPCHTKQGGLPSGLSTAASSTAFRPTSYYWKIGNSDKTHTFDYSVYAGASQTVPGQPFATISGSPPITLAWYTQLSNGNWNGPIDTNSPTSVALTSSASDYCTVMASAAGGSFTFYKESTVWPKNSSLSLTVKFTMTQGATTVDGATFSFLVSKV